MSDILPEETNRYFRINRKELLADTNLSQKGSIKTEVDSPHDWYLLSRVGGDLSTIRSPLPGYCLHFDRSNPDIYITTSIPSSERDNYNIIIKGEGIIDLLFVDDSGTNLVIRPKTYLTSSGYYFDLSYIAFKNKTTNKIEYLFECEESSGNLLYDAVTGDTATIENIASASALRVSKLSKEYIYDDIDLKNVIEFNKDSQGRIDTSLNSLPSIFTIAFELKINHSIDEWFNISNAKRILYKATDITGYDEWLYFYSQGGASTIGVFVKTKNDTSKSLFLNKTSDLAKKLFDRKFHKIAIIAASDSYKWYIDNTLAVSTDRTVVEGFIDNTPLRICTQDNLVDLEYSNFNVFNFDITAEDAKYSLTDFVNNKDVPSSLLNSDYSKFTSIENVVNSGTPIGTVTQASDSTMTYDGYAATMFGTRPRLGSTDTIMLMPGCEVTVKWKIDGYGKQGDTVVNTIGTVSNRLAINQDNAFQSNYNRYWYAGSIETSYEISDVDTGEVLSTNSANYSSNIGGVLNLTENDTALLLRSVDDYQTPRPRILTVKYKLAPNIMKTGALQPCYINLIIRSGSNNDITFTGTIELLGIDLDTALLSLNNFGHNGTVYWLNKTTSSAPAELTRYKYTLPSKNYGTFANAYGYTRNSSNVITPRKVIG